MDKEGYGPADLDQFASGPEAYSAIRGREQMLVDFRGGVSAPNVGNTDNPISILNVNRQLYMETAYKYFGDVINSK